VAYVNSQAYAWVYRVPRSGPRTTVPIPAAPLPDEEIETEN
jgi:hypothetical protein